MAKNGKPGLTQRQKRMIAALLSSRNIGEACTLAGAGRSTLNRWLSDPVFNRELLSAEGSALNQAARQLIAGQDAAIQTLRDLSTGATNESVRRAAANDILDHIFKIRELVSLEDRVKKLEETRNDNTKAN